ncbi:MAG: tetratricopeptide repeat protein [Acidobacteriaceae bacterium]
MLTDSANTPSPAAAAEDLYYSAVDHVAEGQLDRAIADFRAALALDANYLDAMHGLIRALQDAGQLDEAISIANQLIALDPDDVLAHTSLSILYQHKGMVPEAEAESAKAKILGWKQQLKASAQKPE